MPPFHLTLAIHDLDAARAFYGGLLGWREGPSGDDWIVYDFLGHQIVLNRDPAIAPGPPVTGGNNYGVPVPHFGAVLSMEEWQALADRLRSAGTSFLIEPEVSQSRKGEQASMFLFDPSGNAIEIKAMRDRSRLFE